VHFGVSPAMAVALVEGWSHCRIINVLHVTPNCCYAAPANTTAVTHALDCRRQRQYTGNVLVLLYCTFCTVHVQPPTKVLVQAETTCLFIDDLKLEWLKLILLLLLRTTLPNAQKLLLGTGSTPR
jgi:hypothetical protein